MMNRQYSNLILQNEYAIAYYENAIANPSYEPKSRSAWNYILSKVLFPEEHYCVDPEEGPSPRDSTPKVDLILKYFARPGRHEHRALVFIECEKPDAKPRDLDRVEHQAFREAHSLLVHRNNVGPVYAMTTIGMRAHMWRLDSTAESCLSGFDGSTQPLSDPTTYIDIGSANAAIIYDQLMQLKAMAEQERIRP